MLKSVCWSVFRYLYIQEIVTQESTEKCIPLFVGMSPWELIKAMTRGSEQPLWGLEVARVDVCEGFAC